MSKMLQLSRNVNTKNATYKTKGKYKSISKVKTVIMRARQKHKARSKNLKTQGDTMRHQRDQMQITKVGNTYTHKG